MRDLVERGHVGSRHLSEPAENLGARGPRIAELPVALAHLNDRLLALADEQGVKEGGIGLGVVDRGTARNHNGIVLAAVLGHKRNAREVEPLKEVGHGHLVRDVKAHDIKGCHGGRALERKQRHVRRAHGVGHVNPRDVAALARDTRGLVERRVENGDALVGQTDLIGVGVDEACPVVGVGVGTGAPLVVEIAARLLHLGQQRLDLGKAILVGNAHD